MTVLFSTKEDELLRSLAMEAQHLQITSGLPFSLPEVDALLKLSVRTQLKPLLKQQITVEQRGPQLQQSLVNATTLNLANFPTHSHNVQLVPSGGRGLAGLSIDGGWSVESFGR